MVWTVMEGTEGIEGVGGHGACQEVLRLRILLRGIGNVRVLRSWRVWSILEAIEGKDCLGWHVGH